MSELVLTKDNFDKEVMNSDVPVLVDFWASWCGPCKMLSPIIEEIAIEYDGKIKVGKVNVDDEQELASAFGVSSIPLVVLFKDGEVKNYSIGFKPKSEIEALLK